MSQIIDYLILGIIIIGFLLGFKDGFIKKIFSFVGFILAILGALIFSPRLRSFFITNFNMEPSIAVVLSFILIFLVIFISTKIIIHIIRPRKSIIGFIDRFLGGGLGIIQVGLFLSFLLIFLSLFNIPNKNIRTHLKYYDFTYKLVPRAFEFVQSIYPEANIFLNFIEDVKVKIEKGNGRDFR